MILAFPTNIYLFKVNNKSTRERREICLELAIKKRRSAVFIVNFEHISYLFPVFLLLAFNK